MEILITNISRVRKSSHAYDQRAQLEKSYSVRRRFSPLLAHEKLHIRPCGLSKKNNDNSNARTEKIYHIESCKKYHIEMQITLENISNVARANKSSNRTRLTTCCTIFVLYRL